MPRMQTMLVRTVTTPKAKIPRAPGSLGFCVFSVVTCGVFVIIALLPVVCAFLPGGSDPPENPSSHGGSFRSAFLDARQWTLLRNSLTVALGTTVAAGLIGASAGLALEYLRARPRKLLTCGVAASFLVPPHIFAVAWIDLLGANGVFASALRAIAPATEAWAPNIYSTGGAVFVLALSYYPVVTFATILAVRNFDRRMEEAALLVAGRARAVVYIVLPSILPSIFTGMLFVFVVALVSFSVPSLLTVNVYTVEIYSRFSSFHDFREGACLAIPLVICGGVAVAVLRATLGRVSQGGLTGARREQIVTPGRNGGVVVATAGMWLLVFLSAVLPLAVLIVRAQPPGSFLTALETAKSEIVTSLTLAAASATVLCVLGFAVAYRQTVYLKMRFPGEGTSCKKFLP
ncbi:MAG: ABC transporter permease subunit, partial [Thermodesulfobacteriota bacterium]